MTAFHVTQDPIVSGSVSPAMGSEESGSIGVTVPGHQVVRRLTPTECERLQGLPDGWTAHGSDARRYSAIGDAVTVPVAEWIGRRILAHAALRGEEE